MKISKAKICFLMPFLLVLSTVFVVNNELANGVISGKYFWFYGCMGLVALCSVLTQKAVFRFSIPDLFILLFVGSIFISAFVIKDAFLNTTKLTIIALLVLMYFIIRINSNHIQWKIVFSFIIFTGLIEALWGVMQIYGLVSSESGLYKMTGSLFNPGPYAGYLAAITPLAAYKAIEKKNVKEKYFGIAVIVAILLVLPAAKSRAAWLAIIGGNMIVVCHYYFENLKKIIEYLKTKKYLWVAVCLFAAIIIGSLSGMYHLKKDSADGRSLIWKISLQTLAKNPFGVGLGNFSGKYGDMQAVYFASGKAEETEETVSGSPEYAFNEYIQIAVESGIISFILFLFVIFPALRSLIRIHTGAAGSLIAVLVFAGFSYPFSILPFLIILVFLLAFSQSCLNSDSIEDKKPSRFGFHCVFSLFCLAFTCFVIYQQYPVYKSYKQWNKIRPYFEAGQYEKCSKDYKPLYSRLSDNVFFLFEYGQSLSRVGLAGNKQYLEESNAVLQRATKISCDPMLYNIMAKNHQALKEFGKAENYLIKAANIIPSRLYPWYLRAKLYDEMGLHEKTCETAAIVLTKEPKVDSPAIREMREEMEKLYNDSK